MLTINRRTTAVRITALMGTLLGAFMLLSFASVQLSGVEAAPTSGVIYHVDQNVVGGASTGITWTHAFSSLQSALDVAVSGDQIWVAEGVYVPTNQVLTDDVRTKTFSITEGIQLYGGFAATETMLSQRDFVNNKTVLSGDLDGDDITDGDGVLHNASGISGTNAYHVVYAWQIPAVSDTRLDGFVVTGGQANGPYIWFPGITVDCDRNCGGGIKNYGSHVDYFNLIVRGNYGELGGGNYNNGSSSRFVNVDFIGNVVAGAGGAMKNTNSPITLINVVMVGNQANTKFGANGHGGAISNFGSLSKMRIFNTVIAFNSAYSLAGGIQNELLVSTSLTNTIMWGNESETGDSHELYNYPLQDWDTEGIFIGETIAAYSLISWSVPYTGAGNITSTVSPFVQDPSPGADVTWGTADDDYGDLTLVGGAVAIDAGLNGGLPTDPADLDRDGNTAEALPLDGLYNTRVVSSVVDIGAYEYQVAAAAEITPTVALTMSSATTMTLSWDSSGSCTFDVYVGNAAYSGYTLEASDVSSPYELGFGSVPTFYYVAADCGGTAAESNKLGGFQFGLEPGS